MPEMLTRREVLLSWALAEALSPRRAHYYEGVLAAGFATSPEALSIIEQAQLLAVLNKDRGWLIEEYVDPCTRFELGLLRTVDIAETVMMPWMVSSKEAKRATLGKYIEGKYDLGRASDPRNAARNIVANTNPVPYTGFPILAWDKRLECGVIIEGFARLISMLYRLEQGTAPEAVPVIFCRR